MTKVTHEASAAYSPGLSVEVDNDTGNVILRFPSLVRTVQEGEDLTWTLTPDNAQELANWLLQAADDADVGRAGAYSPDTSAWEGES